MTCSLYWMNFAFVAFVHTQKKGDKSSLVHFSLKSHHFFVCVCVCIYSLFSAISMWICSSEIIISDRKFSTNALSFLDPIRILQMLIGAGVIVTRWVLQPNLKPKWTNYVTQRRQWKAAITIGIQLFCKAFEYRRLLRMIWWWLLCGSCFILLLHPEPIWQSYKRLAWECYSHSFSHTHTHIQIYMLFIMTFLHSHLFAMYW